MLESIEKGEEVIIARSGKPVARLIIYREERKHRHPGAWEGKVRYSKYFEGSDLEVDSLFEESDLHPEEDGGED